MRPFHLIVHAAPPSPRSGRIIAIDNQQLAILDWGPADHALPLPLSFEEAFSRLEQLPGMFVELDGSFVWRPPDGVGQVDGVLLDRGEHLQYVELKGSCSEAALSLLIDAVRNDAPLVFQLVQQAVFIEEQELRRWLGWRV